MLVLVLDSVRWGFPCQVVRKTLLIVEDFLLTGGDSTRYACALIHDDMNVG